uniref:Telomerase reverse transcriptase n=2 Tax=Crassostrea virginica TaxID=6565 RepID=A0A8B8DF21_CRAVI|nr:telomerase reverse transcriptase-like isoform X1 [Crassostrea virginica]
MEIIRSMFKFAMPLQEWLCSFGDVHKTNDTKGYVRNLQTTIVAFNVDIRDKLVVSSSPPSETKELVLRVIEKMIRQGEKNVLTLGFGMMSDDPDAQVSCFTNIEYRHPNSSVNLLHQGTWKKIHQGIGDAWMRSLLEETAIFMKCSQTCYIQVTGVPVFMKVKSEGKTEQKKRKRIEDALNVDEPCAKKLKLNSQESSSRLEDSNAQMSDSEGENLNIDKSPPFNPYKFHLYLSQSYLYSSDYREKFPATHPLSRTTPCLYDVISSLDVNEPAAYTDQDKDTPLTAKLKTKLPHLPSLEDLLKDVQENHKSFRYWTILNTCCPINSAKTKLKNTGKKYSEIPDHILLQEYVPPQRVYIFLRKVFIKVIPERLVGCRHNRNIFLKAVKRLVYLGRYEKMCLGDIMKGIKTKSVPWLPATTPHHLKLHLLAKALYWLMNDFIVTLIKVFFYVTETATYRNQLFFYRKRVWSKLHSKGVKDLRKKGVITSIKQSLVTTLLQTGTCLGEATIRFLPKLRSLRPIANLGRQPPATAKSTLPINKQLMNVLTVLSYLASCDASWIGAAKFGNDDIFSEWKSFAENWKNKPHRSSLYFVKTDIKACFDGILQGKLLEILEDLLSEAPDEDVIIRKFVSSYIADGRVVCKFKKHASSFGEYIPDFEKFIKKYIEDNKLSNMVFVNQMINQQMHLEEVFNKLKCHIQNNVIKIGRQYFKQITGISQGSVLSTLLCNIYYGQMEKTFMPPLEDELVIRMVDDALFVTPSRERAELFLCKSIEGNSEYNFSINIDKILVNFDFEHATCGMVKKNVGDWFPWCGMLFNTKTLEVGNDLSRYQGIRMRHTLTIDVSMIPGATMKRKLLMSLRPKCHAIFLDLKLNSLEVCLTNCFRLLLLTAFKFHCYASCLPDKQRVKDNSEFFLAMIHDIAGYLFTQATVQCKRKLGEKFTFDVPITMIKWLCWYSFILKLKCHASNYKKLLKMMKQSLKLTERLLRKMDRNAVKALRKLCGGNIPVELKKA